MTFVYCQCCLVAVRFALINWNRQNERVFNLIAETGKFPLWSIILSFVCQHFLSVQARLVSTTSSSRVVGVLAVTVAVVVVLVSVSVVVISIRVCLHTHSYTCATPAYTGQTHTGTEGIATSKTAIGPGHDVGVDFSRRATSASFLVWERE